LKSVLELWKILVGEWAILFEKCPWIMENLCWEMGNFIWKGSLNYGKWSWKILDSPRTLK
jgi:hypothetical protein